MPPKSLILKLRVSPHHLEALSGSSSADKTDKSDKSDKKEKAEKPKKEKKEKKPAEPKEAKTPKPLKEKKPKKTKKDEATAPPVEALQTPAPAKAATPKPAGSGIKIKLNVNNLKSVSKEAPAQAPITPAPSKAAATASARTLTPAPAQAQTKGASPRPAQLASLPPLQTKLQETPTAGAASTATPQTIPKIRLKASFSEPPKTPIIKLKSNASRPTTTRRTVPIGYGYDSEASDREDDPAIEEQFILRMPPGEDAEFLRQEIEKKEFGKSTDVWFKFKDDRRAVVNIRGKMYSATLVDLPCIIESNKTIDKGKNIFKTADISQMLLVGDRLIFEDQALSNAVPSSLTNYPHGITPPMHWARRRRFRKRVVNRNMDKVEEAVDKLLALDAEAAEASYELLTEAELAKKDSAGDGKGDGDYEIGDEDADGEVYMEYEDDEGEDEEDAGHEELNLMDFENQLAEAMMLDDEPAPPPATNGRQAAREITSDEDEDDDDDDDDEDDGDGMDIDPGTSAEKIQLMEEIADIERLIATKTKEKEGVANQIVRQRIQNIIDGLSADLELKKASLEQMA
ncbi:hypothetical protein AA313_de0201028 [Arthrobotrys entomopaga]|nr:hypothetical protein AA313_de0201028 [Arthrobotrys entomopaga]